MANAGNRGGFLGGRSHRTFSFMNKAFVREGDGGESAQRLPDRPISPHPNLVTAEGLAQIEARLKKLNEQYAAAIASSDLTAISEVARELRYWTARHSTAQVQPSPASTEIVRFGTTVTISRGDGREQTFRIVGIDEADPKQGTLSYISPLAQTLLGKTTGDQIVAGSSEAQVIDIA